MLSMSLVLIGSVVGATTQGGWSFGIHAGPFDPSISESSAVRDYYDLLFTSEENDYIYENRPMLVELEEQSLWDIGFGQAGVAVRFGTWSARGKARVCEDADGSTISCTSETVVNSSPGNTRIRLMAYPLTLRGVYRFDLLERNGWFPLELQVHGGLNYTFWRSTAAGDVATTTVDGSEVEASGGTAGFEFGGALLLGLDFLDPATASRAIATRGMVGSYLVLSYTFATADGFGKPNKIHFSGNKVQLGLAIDFL